MGEEAQEGPTDMGSANDSQGASWQNAIYHTGSLAHFWSPIFFVTCIKWLAFGGSIHRRGQSCCRFSSISEKKQCCSFPSYWSCCSHPHWPPRWLTYFLWNGKTLPYALQCSCCFSHPHLLPERFTPRSALCYYVSCSRLLEYIYSYTFTS